MKNTLRIKLLSFTILTSVLFTGCLTSGLPSGSYTNGDSIVYNNSKISKVKKGDSKQRVISLLGQTKNKNTELNKRHVQKYTKRYIGSPASMSEGIYELWKYYGTKTSHQMGLVGSSYRTTGKSCIVVFNNNDLVEYFKCR